MSRILVTGANGFVGSSLSNVLMNHGYQVCAALRRQNFVRDLVAQKQMFIGNIDKHTRWKDALSDIDYVIHLAARVHVMNESKTDSLNDYQMVNVDGTVNFASQAAAAGVKRFIYLSSIKVNGTATKPGSPFKADDCPAPTDPYAVSKFEAEESLLNIAAATKMEVVIIRPPLVYGPGVKANFLTMMQWLNRGVPLPLGCIQNKRSLIALDNLSDLIVTCIDHPAAANQIFLVADGEDLSTTDLLQRLGKALNRPARLIPFPGNLLKVAAFLVGRQDLIQRLCTSLQVDISKTQDLLGWKPIVKVDNAIKLTAMAYLEKRSVK